MLAAGEVQTVEEEELQRAAFGRFLDVSRQRQRAAAAIIENVE